jgi:diguanylate cyclase (GGDEF)-like protein/PAS domain S-box-containing protein
MKTTVYLREKQESRLIEITSHSKPRVKKEMLNKWQEMLETLAKVMRFPVALIMRVEAEQISVQLTSEMENNPYRVGESERLGIGLYCETVMGENRTLLIENALKKGLWRNNSAVEFDIVSYLGMPISWPDGEIYGTICAVDQVEKEYSSVMRTVMIFMRDSIEKDLSLIIECDRVAHQNEFLSDLVNTMSTAMVLMDQDLRIVLMNQHAERIIGIEQKEVVGKKASELIDHPQIMELEEHFVQSGVSDYPIDFPQKLGNSHYYLIDYHSIYSSRNKLTHVAVNIRDISRIKSIEDELSYKNEVLNQLAVRDRLTNLYNHVTIHELLYKNLEEAIRYKSNLAIAMIDIDNFKEINTSYGHRIGDHLLADVARILRESVRGADIVGRYGGEEFMVIMPQTDVDAAYQVMERVRVYCEEREFDKINLTISAGLVMLENESSMEKLINCVEQALYRAKSIGKNVVVVKHNC